MDYQRVSVTAQAPANRKVNRAVAQTLDEEQQAYLAEGLAADADGLAEQGYVRSEACAPCHGRPYAQWLGSAHASALSSLAKRDSLRPECLACHWQASRQTAKILPLEGKEHGVECSTCHEGAALHLAIPQAGNIGRGTRDACAGCHTKVRDPEYDGDKRWETIAH